MERGGNSEAVRPGTVRAVLGQASGANVVVEKLSDGDEIVPSGGTIFVDDMPSLENVLRKMEVITAVLERPAPQVSEPGTDVSKAAAVEADHVAWRDALVLGGIPVGLIATGGCLLVVSVAQEPFVPNPYIAIFLILAGVVLALTARRALQDSRAL